MKMFLKAPTGGDGALPPQQIIVLSVRRPHVQKELATMRMKVPGGGVACPVSFLPQQTTAPPRSIPHVCASPAARSVNTPEGGVARPEPSSPVHATLPSWRRPHMCCEPTAIRRKGPGGGTRGGKPAAPEQAAVPSARSPHANITPAATWTNEPAGASTSPEHWMVPSVRRTQMPVPVSAAPAKPCGGNQPQQTDCFDWIPHGLVAPAAANSSGKTKPNAPQQVTVPSAPIAQKCCSPAEISVNVPEGGLADAPSLAPFPWFPWFPQQVIVPSRRIPHPKTGRYSPPVSAMRAKLPGGDARPTQLTLPSVRTPQTVPYAVARCSKVSVAVNGNPKPPQQTSV